MPGRQKPSSPDYHAAMDGTQGGKVSIGNEEGNARKKHEWGCYLEKTESTQVAVRRRTLRRRKL